MAGIITDKIRRLNPVFNHGYVPMPGTEHVRLYVGEDDLLYVNITGTPELVGSGVGGGGDVDGGRADSIYGGEIAIDCGNA